MVAVIRCNRPRRVGLGLIDKARRTSMSFIVAGCALLLALLAGIVLDDVGVRRRTRRDLPSSTSLTFVSERV
jgi:hypothetical protein